MPNRKRIKDVALDFLQVVAIKAESKLGKRPERLQRSQWMVHTGPGSMSSNVFERRVFDSRAVDMLYQKELMRSDFPEQKQLTEVLVAAGIRGGEVRYGFLLPLLRHWLELPDPFTFQEEAISQVLEEFCDAVIDKVVMTASRNAILHLDLVFGPILLEEGVFIRPIQEKELWELGDLDNQWPFYAFFSFPFNVPSEDWKILDIQIGHTGEEGHPSRTIGIMREAALAALVLASPGALQVLNLVETRNYGMGAVGVLRGGGPTPRELGRGGGPYIIDAVLAQRLKNLWPGLRRIMASERHHLRIPAQRLVDGGNRSREDDAIIDYAIGLEALLMKGINAELSYRFALRGATVLTWNGGDKKKLFDELRDFYEVRSNIVHGSHVDPTKLRNARSTGEKALRDIWWWYFDNKESLSAAMSKVDQRLLE